MKKKLTPQEEQRRSFAYGNTKIKNPDITRKMIDEAAERIEIDKKKMNKYEKYNVPNNTHIAISLELLFDFYVGMRNGACYRVRDLLEENGCVIPEKTGSYAELEIERHKLEIERDELQRYKNDYPPDFIEKLQQTIDELTIRIKDIKL